jgi:hypothetical protein
LASRREKLNAKQLKGYLPPAPGQNIELTKTQEGIIKFTNKLYFGKAGSFYKQK